VETGAEKNNNTYIKDCLKGHSDTDFSKPAADGDDTDKQA